MNMEQKDWNEMFENTEGCGSGLEKPSQFRAISPKNTSQHILLKRNLLFDSHNLMDESEKPTWAPAAKPRSTFPRRRRCSD